MTTTRDIPIEKIHPGSNQARRHFDERALDELAESLRSSGVIQPIVLRSDGDQFELLAGERRWRAAQRAGLATVPAIVRDDLDPVAAQVLGLVENLQRESLSPMETAYGLKRLATLLDLTHEKIGQRVGKSRAYVSNFLRLLTLCEDVGAMVDAGQLSMGHARALAGVDAALQRRFAKDCLSGQWSVRRLERAIARGRNGGSTPARREPEWERLERQLGEHLACPVTLQADGSGRGELRLRFFSLDELDGLLEQLGYRE
ncbi:ParB/RepB/Spo0J family partition protein [Algiphilus sp.]|uniref:ParB/RepB/Spo0J family partition protein n=1 Tax=Algiphilus sp. TaxID=1872431 RepID=UPI003B5164C6